MALVCPGQRIVLQTSSFLSRILLNRKWLKRSEQATVEVDHSEDSKGSEEHTFANMCSIWKHYMLLWTCVANLGLFLFVSFISYWGMHTNIDVEMFDCDSRKSLRRTCVVSSTSKLLQNKKLKWWKVLLSDSCMNHRNIDIYIIYLLYISHISPWQQIQKRSTLQGTDIYQQWERKHILPNCL